jgi:hypothetical protein
MRALAHARENRYATALEMRDALDAYVISNGLRMQPRELGLVVAESFASERAQFKAQLEAQLAVASTLPILGRQQGALSVPVVDTRAGSGSSSVAGPSDTSTLNAPVNRSLVLALALALVVVGVLIGVLFANRPSEPQSTALPTTSPPALPTKPVLQPEPTPPLPTTAAPTPAPPAPTPTPPPSPTQPGVAPPVVTIAPSTPDRTLRTQPNRKQKKGVAGPTKPKDDVKDVTSPPPSRSIDIVKDPEVDIVE